MKGVCVHSGVCVCDVGLCLCDYTVESVVCGYYSTCVGNYVTALPKWFTYLSGCPVNALKATGLTLHPPEHQYKGTSAGTANEILGSYEHY